MSEKTLAAAVARAADTGTGAAKSTPEPITLERIKAEAPALFGEIMALGADAESQRIAGIEAAAMPGHEKLIAAHKADRSKTPADAALAVIKAENDMRAGMLKGLTDDEAKLKGLRSEPAVEPKAKAAHPAREAHGLAKKARDYIAAQAKLGITVSAAEAVAHIEQEG